MSTTKDTPFVIACTEDDICAGGYGPLPRDLTAVHEASDEEKAHLKSILKGYAALKRLGWNDAVYAPRETKLLLIEVGSTGIHEGYRDEVGFWIYDGDVWPSKPTLFKILEPKP